MIGCPTGARRHERARRDVTGATLSGSSGQAYGRAAPIGAALLLLATVVLAWHLASDGPGRLLAYALGIGFALGVTLQRTRFCFFCHLRDLVEEGDARGSLAILLALAVGAIGMHLVFTAWLPVPVDGRLPPDAHIGPVSWVLVAAAAAFGVGMVLSGSCISAHWYRLGEGSPIAPFALIGCAAGFIVGYQTWDPLYRSTVATAPVVWLPSYLGYGGSLALQLGGLGLLGWLAWRRSIRWAAAGGAAAAGLVVRPERIDDPPTTLVELGRRVFGLGRWPYWLGGLLVGWLSTLVLLRSRPLGVTATLAGAARDVGDRLGIVPATLPGLDQLGGCIAQTAARWWATPNALLIAGLVVGAWSTALLAGQFRPRRPRSSEILRGLGGGLLLGWGAMTALGCTVGTLLSGTMAGALSGWVFGLVMLGTVWAGIRLGWAPRRPAG